MNKLLVCSPVLIVGGSLNMELRLKAIGNGLSLPYIMMSLSYEPLFLLAFFISLYNWVEVEIILCSRRMKQLKDFQFVEPKIDRKRDIGWNDLRSAAVFVSSSRKFNYKRAKNLKSIIIFRCSTWWSHFSGREIWRQSAHLILIGFDV